MKMDAIERLYFVRPDLDFYCFLGIIPNTVLIHMPYFLHKSFTIFAYFVPFNRLNGKISQLFDF